MKIPSKIQIAGIIYDVIFCDEVIITDEGNQQTASVDFKNTTIKIYQKLNDQMVDLSWMHELTHAVLLAAGHIDGSRLRVDEPFVERLGHLWLQVFNQILDFNLKK